MIITHIACANLSVGGKDIESKACFPLQENFPRYGTERNSFWPVKKVSIRGAEYLQSGRLDYLLRERKCKQKKFGQKTAVRNFVRKSKMASIRKLQDKNSKYVFL